MAGSLRAVSYTSDTGVRYACLKDESNSEATTTGGVRLVLDLPAPPASPGMGIPSNLTPRVALATLTTDPTVRKRFLVGNPAAFTLLQNGGQITETNTPRNQGGVYNVTMVKGEMVRAYVGGDTGQTDGDNP